MKRLTLALVTASTLVWGTAIAQPVRDWQDLHGVHEHVAEAIHEMERARAANHYDMDGHGAKAEALLRRAERQLHDAVESIKRGH